MLRSRLALFVLILLTSLAACTRTNTAPAPSPTASPRPSRTPPPSVTPFPTPTKRATITPEPSSTGVRVTVTANFNPAGERIVFQAEDGQELVGYYYISPHPNSPVVVLMHQFGSSQQLAWPQSDLIPWLQNAPSGDPNLTPTLSAQGNLPPMPPGLHFNVFTFDFRGHGESPGKTVAYLSDEAQKWYLLDAKAAYQQARQMPHANPGQIIGMGTSIGADAAVDACEEGCLGAFSISPGSWLGEDWATNAYRLANAGKPVRCIYSFNDDSSPQTCLSLEITKYYRIAGYEGKKHGQDFLIPRKMEAGFGQILLDFFLQARAP